MVNKRDSEISLYEFFQVLWAGRVVISIFIAISLLIAIIYLSIKTPSYESKMFYTVDILPPSVDTDLSADNVRMLSGNIRLDYEVLFYKKSLFDEWKNKNKNSSLTFQAISAVEEVNGIEFSRKSDDKLVAFIKPQRKSRPFYINARTNDLSFLNNLYDYSNYVNDALTQRYLNAARQEQKIVKNLSNDDRRQSDLSFKMSVNIAKFILSIQSGERLLNVSRPTVPEKISPINRLVIIFALFVGFLIGCFYVHLKNSIKDINKTV